MESTGAVLSPGPAPARQDHAVDRAHHGSPSGTFTARSGAVPPGTAVVAGVAARTVDGQHARQVVLPVDRHHRVEMRNDRERIDQGRNVAAGMIDRGIVAEMRKDRGRSVVERTEVVQGMQHRLRGPEVVPLRNQGSAMGEVDRRVCASTDEEVAAAIVAVGAEVVVAVVRDGSGRRMPRTAATVPTMIDTEGIQTQQYSNMVEQSPNMLLSS